MITRYRRGQRFREICREYLANLIYGPSYISLDYALSLHGLIPERVETITSVTTRRSRHFDTPFGTFSYRMLNGRRYAVGVLLESADQGGDVLVPGLGRFFLVLDFEPLPLVFEQDLDQVGTEIRPFAGGGEVATLGTGQAELLSQPVAHGHRADDIVHHILGFLVTAGDLADLFLDDIPYLLAGQAILAAAG